MDTELFLEIEGFLFGTYFPFNADSCLKKIFIVHFLNLSLGNRHVNLEFKILNLELVKVLAWSHGGTKKAYLVLMFEL